MYKLSKTGNVIRIEDGANIPADPANTDYQVFLDWLAGGGAALPIDQPTHQELVDATLTEARQMRLPIISILDGMQSSALTNSDLVIAQAIEVAKTGLKNITKVDLSGCTTAEEMRLAVLNAYTTIAQAVPDGVKIAFAQVLA